MATKSIVLEGEKFYYSLGFDIGEHDGGLWWLQIYDSNHNLIHDKPFVSSISVHNEKAVRRDVRRIINQEILYTKGLII